MVGNLGGETSVSWSQARRITVFLDPETWTTADSNRAPPACKAGALPDELAAQGRRGYNRDGTFGRQRHLPYGAHAMDVSISKRVHPSGGAVQGWQELNPHLPGFGDRAPIRWLI